MKNIEIKITQHNAFPTEQQFDSRQHWVILLPLSADPGDLPYAGRLLSRRRQLGNKKSDTEAIEMDLANTHGSHVAFACIDRGLSAFALLSLARKLIVVQQKHRAERLGIVVYGFEAAYTERVTESIIAAACAASADMPSYKSDRQAPARLRRLDVYGLKLRHGFRRSLIEAEGNALARYLSMLPSNELTPGKYLQRIKKLSRREHWKLQFYDLRALQKKQAGAFLAVAQGSPVRDAGIVRLQYRPESSAKEKKVVLLGKGICYDTGGTNLKPAKYMFGMHEDMQGSAVALGTFLALTRLRVDFPLECWLALAMNHIGPKAYKPNDVVIAADGSSIEIVHTDAEGRMVLADTLALAAKQKPALIIDYATLTGACVYSLGTAYSGVFSNRDNFHSLLVQAGKDSGERVWPFPLDEDYDKDLESNIADVKQCALEGDADHILAARFLQRFIKNNTPWIHIDLASSSRKGGLAHIPTDTTGFGVRFTLNLLLDKKLLSA